MSVRARLARWIGGLRCRWGAHDWHVHAQQFSIVARQCTRCGIWSYLRVPMKIATRGRDRA